MWVNKMQRGPESVCVCVSIHISIYVCVSVCNCVWQLAVAST